jgi:hypothetical protein
VGNEVIEAVTGRLHRAWSLAAEVFVLPGDGVRVERVRPGAGSERRNSDTTASTRPFAAMTSHSSSNRHSNTDTTHNTGNRKRQLRCWHAEWR